MANYKNDTLINVIIIVIPRLAIKRLLEAKAKEKKVQKKFSRNYVHPSNDSTHTANFKRKSWKIKIVSCYSYDIVFNIQLRWPNSHERTAGEKAVLTVDCI